MSEPVQPVRSTPIRSVKGTRDLLPRDTALWLKVEEEARRVLAAYHFGEIRTPILEQTNLVARSVGEDTDIVGKEMYTWEDHEVPELALLRAEIRRTKAPVIDVPYNREDVERQEGQIEKFTAQVNEAMNKGQVPKTPENQGSLNALGQTLQNLRRLRKEGDGFTYELAFNYVRDVVVDVRLGDSLTLRPEATASVVRAYIEHSLYNEGGAHKLYYIGPMFRRDRPQKGRYRQFYQIGAEVLGSEHPAVDVEVLEMLALFLGRVGLREFTLLINSVGDKRCRPAYVETLRKALVAVKDQMCSDCRRRADTNPLRVLDCKVHSDQPIIDQLPRMIDHLDPECRRHFDAVLAGLDHRGIAYQITPRLVRGLDYYTRTTFEITSSVLGAQNSLLGGGRYDGLSEMIGGPPAPGIGFAIGEDRLALAVEAAGELKPAGALAVYVAWLGEAAAEPAARLAHELREHGLSVEIGYEPAKLKKSLGTASKLGARFAIIIGEGELASGRYQVKDLATGQQEAVEPARLAGYLSQRTSPAGT
ncbi:MAG TPA: histidine--tRNA ligase [Terriglobia bacterium]